MKLLRVLTGSHAGARLALSEGLWRIAAPHAAQDPASALSILLEDWRNAPVSLRLAGGVVQLNVEADGQDNWLAWPDLEARRFGDTVLCVGEEAAQWPADVTLLAPLVQPPSRPVAQPGVSRHPKPPWRRALGWRAALVAVASGSTLALVVASPTPTPVDAPAAALREAGSRAALAAHNVVRVRAALADLADAQVSGLQVGSEGGRVRVTGLLDSAQADSRVRTALLPFRDEVSAGWQLAPELLDSLRSALHGQGVAVRDVGNGVYVVEGTTPRPDTVRSMAARLAQDLAPGVRAVQVEVQAPVSRPRLAAQLETGGTRYAVRPDGAKAFGP